MAKVVVVVVVVEAVNLVEVSEGKKNWGGGMPGRGQHNKVMEVRSAICV